MAERWATCALSVVLALSACGGKSVDRAAAGNQAGGANGGGSFASGGEVASGGDVSVVGGSSSGGSTTTPAELTTSEWNVKFQFEFAHPVQSTSGQNCGYLAATLDLVAADVGVDAFLGADGSMSRANFFHATELDSLDLSGQVGFDPAPGPCDISSYQFETLTLHAVDSDNDGQFDRLEGSGKGSANVVSGDTIDEVAMTVTVNGVPDDTAPSVSVGTNAHHPLDLISLPVSEPLKTAKLYLDNNSSPVTFEIPTAGDALIRLYSPLVLPLGQTYHLAGSAMDFAGHPLGTALSYTTLKNPGFFAQDGFEGPLAAVLMGNAKVIDQSFGIALPSGSHALFIPPDSSATLHLANPSMADGTLKLTFIRLYSSSTAQDNGDVRLEAAAVGGMQRLETDFNVTGSGTPIQIDQWQLASAPTALSMHITEPAPDAIVRISASTYGSPPYPPTALVIDDLTLN